MSNSKTPVINIDDADNIRRFIEQMSLRTSTANPPTSQVEKESAIQLQSNGISTDEHRDLYKNSTKSSPPAVPEHPVHPFLPVHAVAQAHDMQSPQARGVLAPPPTPQTPSVNDVAGKDINDHTSDTSSEFSALNTFTLGESRYATDKKASLLGPARAVPDVIVAHAPRSSQLTAEQRKARDQSFARMSFVAAEQPPTIFEEPSKIEADPKPTVASKLAADSKLAAWKLASDLKEAEEKSIVTDKPAVKSQGTFMDHWMVKSGSSGIKKPVVSEESTKASVNDRPRTPPHLRAAKPAAVLPLADDVEKLVSSGEATKASVIDRPVTPPHLRAAKHAVFNPATFHTAVQEDLIAQGKLPPHSSPTKLASDDGSQAAKTQVAQTPKPREYTPSRGTLAAQAVKTDETLKHAAVFESWPKAQGRDSPANRARKVVLTGLPPASSPVFVASLIHGGPVENISLPSPTSAFVLFLNPDDAVNFYKATANGIECVKEGVKYVVLCEMNAEEVDVVGGKLRMWIDMGMTRCVRAIGAIGQEWTLGKLYGLAEAKGRKVEVIEVGENPGGLRSIIFRFSKLDHAVEFKQSLSRSDDWEHCNIHFSADPCADASKA